MNGSVSFHRRVRARGPGLLRSTEGHLNLPFVPITSSIGGRVQAIDEIVVIHNAIVLSTHRIGRTRDDCNTRPVHGDRSGSIIDLPSQEGIRSSTR
jgi:hypothetical protein